MAAKKFPRNFLALGLGLLLASTAVAQETPPKGVPTQLPAKKSVKVTTKASSQTTSKAKSKTALKTKTAKGRSNQKVAAAKAPEGSGKLPTTLPPYKGPRRVVINFDDPQLNTATSSQTSTVLPSPSVASPGVAIPTDDSFDAMLNDLSPESALLGVTSEAAMENGSVKVTTPEREPTPNVMISQPAEDLRRIEEPAAFTSRLPAPVPSPSPWVRPPEELLSLPAPRTEAQTEVQPTLETDHHAAPLTEARPTASTVAASDTVVSTSAPSSARLQLRTAYLHAKYSGIESRLENGATSLGFALSRVFGSGFEGGLALDAVHGLDQSVSPENTRMVVTRVAVGKFFSAQRADILGKLRVSPFVAGGLGYLSYAVQSVRAVDGATLTVKRHASGQAFALIPAVGGRLDLTRQISFDFALEYLGVFGTDHASSLGGLTTSAGISLLF